MSKSMKALNVLKDFYNQKSWRAKRRYILARDGYQCAECLKYGRTSEAKVVHHIIPLEEYALMFLESRITFEKFYGLSLEDKNLVSLCHTCHNKKHPEKGGNY